MSSAFIKEDDDMWLHDIAPTLDALCNYLTRENGGLKIIERENYYCSQHQASVHKMSDGFLYLVRENKWVCLD